MLGITHFDYSRHHEIVDRFCDLARCGTVMTGDPPGHADGWGLAFYKNGESIILKSGGNLLDETHLVTDALSKLGRSPVMILHLRKSAWKDSTNTRHAHPFRHNNTVFVHNGVVYDYQRLLPDIHTPGLGADALDTEVFFHHFLSGKSGDLGRDFLDTATHIRRHHRFSALNCLFSDGARLYAYRDYAKEPDYYSLYKALSDESCLVSSEPLDEALRWEMMAKEEFLVAEAKSAAD